MLASGGFGEDGSDIQLHEFKGPRSDKARCCRGPSLSVVGGCEVFRGGMMKDVFLPWLRGPLRFGAELDINF